MPAVVSGFKRRSSKLSTAETLWLFKNLKRFPVAGGRLECFWFWILGFGFWNLGVGSRVLGFGFRIWGLGFRILDFGFRICR